jgi:hypothetical protein
MDPRRFNLVRSIDKSGVSGTGVVAQGVEFPDGFVLMRWLGQIRSVSIFNSIDEVDEIHGHQGCTKILWVDGE